MKAAFFRAAVRDGVVTTSGTPSFFGGHRLPGGEDGVFGEWRWDGHALRVRTDRYGAYPLFYCAREHTIAVSPSVVTLLREGAPAGLDDAAVAAFLRLGFFVGDDTPIASIRALPPDARLTWTAGTLTIAGGYTFGRAQAVSRASAVDGFITLFRAAVARRTAPGLRVMLPLSGGRDSRQILLALAEAGGLPRACVTVRPFPPRAHLEVDIARAVARAVGVPHVVVEQHGSRIQTERRKNVLTEFCSDEHAHFLVLAEYLKAHAEISYDGLGGDMLTGQSSSLQPAVLRMLDEEQYEDAAALMFEGYGKRGIEEALGSLLPGDLYSRVNRQLAIERVVRELGRHAAAPHRAMSFFFWNRTRRELALAPYAMMDGTTVYSPYLDHAVFDFLTSIPAVVTADHLLHTEAITRAYPGVRAIPFEERPSSMNGGWFVRRTAIELAREAVRSGAAVRRSYVVPRLALAAATGRPHYVWFLPQAIYLDQLAAATGRGTGAARQPGPDAPPAVSTRA